MLARNRPSASCRRNSPAQASCSAGVMAPPSRATSAARNTEPVRAAASSRATVATGIDGHVAQPGRQCVAQQAPAAPVVAAVMVAAPVQQAPRQLPVGMRHDDSLEIPVHQHDPAARFDDARHLSHDGDRIGHMQQQPRAEGRVVRRVLGRQRRAGADLETQVRLLAGQRARPRPSPARRPPPAAPRRAAGRAPPAGRGRRCRTPPPASARRAEVTVRRAAPY